MSNIKKKGISSVIATLILIVVGIVAVTMLWTAVPVLLQPTEQQFSCAEISINPPISLTSVNYNLEEKEIEAEIRKIISSPIEINSIEFTLSYKDSPALNFACTLECEFCILPKSSEKYYFYSEKPAKQIIISVNGCPIIQSEI